MIKTNNNNSPSIKKPCGCTARLLCRSHYESRQRIFGKSGKHVSAPTTPRRWHVDITCPSCTYVNRSNTNECMRCGACVR